MELIKWNPMTDMFGLSRQTNSIFDDFFYGTDKNEDSRKITNWSPKVDIFEEDNSIILQAEIPGVDKSDIDVNVSDGYLTVTGKRSYDHEVKEENYYRKERSFGSFKRRFKISKDVNPETIVADYRDGVLKVSIPKPEERKPKKITVH